MNSSDDFRVWYPIVDAKKGTVTFFLTGAQGRGTPSGGREFVLSALAATGVRAEVVAWGFRAGLTRYFSGTRWDECWLAELLVDEVTMGNPDDVAAGVPVSVPPDVFVPTERLLPVQVIADFPAKARAVACRDELRAQAKQAAWNEIHYERYALRPIGRKLHQLVIDVVTRDRDDIDAAVTAADRVAEVCARHDGTTSADPG